MNLDDMLRAAANPVAAPNPNASVAPLQPAPPAVSPCAPEGFLAIAQRLTAATAAMAPPPAVAPVDPIEGDPVLPAPFTLSHYLNEARELVAQQPVYEFRELPDACAHWLLIEYRTTADLISLDETLSDYFDAVYVKLESSGTFKTAKVTNKEARTAFTNQHLLKDPAYTGLKTRVVELKKIQALARANAKRYGRMFEVQSSRIQHDLVQMKLHGVAELLAALPIK